MSLAWWAADCSNTDWVVNMAIADWGLVGTPQRGFQNALAMGMQMGAQAREARDAREYRNALAQFDPANPDTLKPIMEIRPDVGLQLRGQVQAQQAQQAEKDLVTRALGGDDEALTELATVNFDAFKTLSAEQKAAAAQETTVLGNAALDVLGRPPEQRSQAVLAYAQQMGSEEIARIAQLPPDQLDAALRTAVAEAKMVDKLMAMEKPQTLNVQPGAGVYQRDPVTGQVSTVIQPNFGGAAPLSPVQQGGGQPAPERIGVDEAEQIFARSKQAGAITPEDFARMAEGRSGPAALVMKNYLKSQGIKIIKRTGTAPDGRRVVEFEDGTIEYAAN